MPTVYWYHFIYQWNATTPVAEVGSFGAARSNATHLFRIQHEKTIQMKYKENFEQTKQTYLYGTKPGYWANWLSFTNSLMGNFTGISCQVFSLNAQIKATFNLLLKEFLLSYLLLVNLSNKRKWSFFGESMLTLKCDMYILKKINCSIATDMFCTHSYAPNE